MRILVTADTVGGVWTYTRELVTGLTRRGFDVVLVSFGSIPPVDQTRWMNGLSNLDYRPTGFKLEWMQDSADDLRASAEYLETIADETRPDLIHLNQFYYGAIKTDAPRLVVAHSDVVSWWVAVHGCEPPESEWISWYRAVLTRGVMNATAVVAPSRWMLEQIGRHYAHPLLASVIYNGRTPTLFHSNETKDQTISSVGRVWDSGKNVNLLLQEQLPWPVCIVGSDQEPGASSAFVQQQQSRSGVEFLPQQNEEQLCELLSRTAVYAAVSRYEPFGLAPVEAALSGCAIVASDIDSFRELWGTAALFFRNNDASSLRETLAALADGPELRQSYADRARDHARQWFTADRMVDQYLGFYNKLLRGEMSLKALHTPSVVET